MDNYSNYFPVGAQQTPSDRSFIFNVLCLLRGRENPFSYVEIGSYLGGSLAPFLIEGRCERVFSVDDRGRAEQPDERGARYSFKPITSAGMVENLKRHGVDTGKLETFDGSIEQVRNHAFRYDLALIDGEHTDEATFRDYLYIRELMKPNCIIMFHDSSLIAKAIRLISVQLDKDGTSYRFFKNAESEISAFFFGSFAKIDLEPVLGESVPMEEYAQRAEAYLLAFKVKHRVKIRLKYKLHSPPLHKLSRLRDYRLITRHVVPDIAPPELVWTAPPIEG